MFDRDADDVLTGWTIFNHPSDYPQHIVVRRWWVVDGGIQHAGVAVLCQSLEEAREQIPVGTIRFEREEADDAVIIETWL